MAPGTLSYGLENLQKRSSGVGFMLRTSIASKLENLQSGHFDRIMSMRLPLENKKYVTLFSVYAPTLQGEPAVKGNFYSKLCSLFQSIPENDKILIFGDFNARAGQDAAVWKRVPGRNGVGNYNENGCLLLEVCTEQQLVITNSISQKKNSLKTTWMHSQSKHWHCIDYVLARQRDLMDVLTPEMPSAECPTDHRLVGCKLRMHFEPRPKNEKPLKKKFKLSMLQSAEVKADFQTNRPSLEITVSQKILLPKHSGTN